MLCVVVRVYVGGVSEKIPLLEAKTRSVFLQKIELCYGYAWLYLRNFLYLHFTFFSFTPELTRDGLIGGFV